MERIFDIIWKENKKYNAIERKTIVSIKGTDDLATDAKAALNVFISINGNLKKNEIISIQEVNEFGKPIGEPIKPTNDESIVPVK